MYNLPIPLPNPTKVSKKYPMYQLRSETLGNFYTRFRWVLCQKLALCPLKEGIQSHQNERTVENYRENLTQTRNRIGLEPRKKAANLERNTCNQGI